MNKIGPKLMTLPKRCQVEILSFLNVSELPRVAKTGRWGRSVTLATALWQVLFKLHWKESYQEVVDKALLLKQGVNWRETYKEWHTLRSPEAMQPVARLIVPQENRNPLFVWNVRFLQAVGDDLYSGVSCGPIDRWNLKTMTHTNTQFLQRGKSNELALSSDGTKHTVVHISGDELYCCAEYTNVVEAFNRQTGKTLREYSGATSLGPRIQATQDRVYATIWGGASLIEWNRDLMAKTREIQILEDIGGNKQIEIAEDSIYHTAAGKVVEDSLRTGKSIRTFEHPRPNAFLTFQIVGDSLYTFSSTLTIVWNRRTGEATRQIVNQETVWNTCCTPRVVGDLLLSCSSLGYDRPKQIQARNLHTGKLTIVIATADAESYLVHGNRLFIGGNGSIAVYDISKPVHYMKELG